MADYENGLWKRDYVYCGSFLLATVDASGARYLLMDHQGSTRAVMNSTQIVERHDYKPFGEELGAGTGLRTPAQGYGVQNPVRQQYALTERDPTTGLDHAWFRKSDSSAGRWTSPDPYGGSMSIADPQSMNRYSYVENDLMNFIDPTGLLNFIDPSGLWWINDATQQGFECTFFGAMIDCGLARRILTMEGVYLYVRVFIGRDDYPYFWRTFTVSSLQDDDILKKKLEERFHFSEIRRKQQIYSDCMAKERAKIFEELKPELKEIMKRNLRDHVLALFGILAGGAIPLIVAETYVSARNSDRFADFNNERLQPRLRAAEQKCKDEAGIK